MTITVIRERLPSKLKFGQISGPGYSTQVVTTAGGFRYSNQYWANPLRRYQIDTEHAGIAESQSFSDFQHAVAQGRQNIWLANDLADNASAGGPWPRYAVTAAQFAVADASVLVYQLFKPYVFGSKTYERKITNPNSDVSGAVKIFVNGAQDSGAAIDYSTGLVTLSSHPNNGDLLTWIGTFDVPCRFDEDYQQMSFENPAQINGKSITFTEERLS